MRLIPSRPAQNQALPRLAQMLKMHESGSPFAVAGESLMNRLLSNPGPPPCEILITSAGPQEGKTTIAAHLAITMALARKKVLIIDADLRAPSLHEVFDIDPGFGFSDILDDAKADDVIQTVKLGPGAADPHRSLSVITSGQVRPDLFKVLGSEQIERTLQDLRNTFDFVVLDTPPVLAVSDALPLMRLVDGVVLVLKSGGVRERDAVAAKALAVRSGGEVLGIVMNLFVEKLHGAGLSSHYGDQASDGARP